jgi:hypothetical protein
MNPQVAKEILDKIIGQIFGYQNPLSLEQFMQKYAFDIRLPVQVTDSTTGQPTWAQSANPTRFITMDNAHKNLGDGMLPKRPLGSIEDVLAAWGQINLTATERQIESLNLAESDNIYNSDTVYRSLDVTRSKNVLFCDGIQDSEFVAACTRSNTMTFCARIEDSKECSNSFSVSWSGKIVNSMFVHDSYDLYECLFCSHINSKKFCIANMQFEEAEYRQLKELVVRWVLTS